MYESIGVETFFGIDHHLAEPDNDPPQEMGDASKTELSDAESDAFDAKRSEAMSALGEGEWQKASELFTEAIKVWIDSSVKNIKLTSFDNEIQPYVDC